MEDTNQISVNKLKVHWNPFTENPWLYIGTPITRTEVRREIQKGRLNAEPGGIKRIDHIRRVAYLVVNGWSDPIEVDFGCPTIAPSSTHLEVSDGNHRLAAAIYRKDPTILTSAAGEVDFIEEFED